MRIAVHSSSASVRRTLGQIIDAAGHTLCTAAHPPELVIIDTLHPGNDPLPADSTTLTLGTEGSDSNAWLECPLPPARLIQKLTHWQQTRVVRFGDGWSLDNSSRQLSHTDGALLSLTEKECALLQQLLSAAEHTMPRDDLLEAVWGVGDTIDTHTLETHIYRLRSKLEELRPTPGQIVTEAGSYRFVR